MLCQMKPTEVTRRVIPLTKNGHVPPAHRIKKELSICHFLLCLDWANNDDDDDNTWVLSRLPFSCLVSLYLSLSVSVSVLCSVVCVVVVVVLLVVVVCVCMLRHGEKREKNRVHVQNASVCTLKTSACVLAPSPHI